MPENLIPVSAASKQLQMTTPRIIRRLAIGEIPGAKIDGRWYVDTSVLPTAARPEEEK